MRNFLLSRVGRWSALATMVITLVAGAAWLRTIASPSALAIVCGGESLTMDALAARRGLTVEEAQSLFALGFTTETLCTAREEILRQGLRMATRPKPSFPGEYLEWRKESLVDENGIIDPNGLMRAKAHVDMMREFGTASPSGAGIGRTTWSSHGPGNIGGRIRAMVIHPNNHDTMFVGSVAGGIWKTINGGTSWTVVNDFMANIAVSTIVMQPGSPSVMYAGTGEGYYNGDGIRGAGIFKSTDSGVTWAQLGSTSTSTGTGIAASDFHYVNRLAMSPNGNVLLAATRTGIFRSTNGGTTFARATLVGGGGITAGLGITDIDFHPTDNARAIAGTFGGTSLYSTDGGATWTLAAGMPAGSFFPGPRVETAYAPSDGSTVYASVDLDGGSLYRSLDGGQSFVEILDGAIDSQNPLQSQGWYDNLLWVSPADANFIVWGGIDNFKSTNGGLTFTKISQWFSHNFSNPTSAHADQHIAVAHPGFNGTTNRTVFFANDGGVYRATDVATVGGDASPYQAGWTELNNGLAITQFYGAAGHPATGRLTGGTQDNGTLFFNPSTANAAENWTSPFGGDGGFSAYDSADSNYFYGEFIFLTLHRNSTGGASPSAFIWTGLTDANTSNSEFISAFVLDPNNNNRLLGAAVRLWRTNNVKAATPAWESIKNSVGTSAEPNHISAIAVVPGNSDIIYVGHDTGKLYKTTSGTSDAATVRASWVTIDDNGAANPLPDRRMTRITVNPSSVNTVYVTFGGFSGDNVYKSTDAGVTWTDVTGPSGGANALPDVPVRDLEVHPSNSNWLYAGTEVGIFTSENGGSTWNLPHDGPSNVPVDELFFLNTRIYAVTHGRGIFSTETTATPPVAINDAYTLNAGTTLSVAAPGVLANDVANTTGPITASLSTNPTSGTVILNADGSFAYTPTAGFEGTDSFTYRAANSAGPSNTATATITVIPQLAAPVGLTAEVAGNTLTLRWSAGVGQLTPDSYQLEGGTAPGTTQAALPIAGNTGTVVLAGAPDGVFYLRLRARSGALLSRASNEIEVRIGSAAPPGAPTNFLASASGSTLAMAWMPARLGGTLTAYQLRVATSPGGPIIAALDFAPTETLVALPGVPAGTYYLRLVAVGPAGASSATPEVAVTVPGTCTAPQPVTNFRRSGTGADLILEWDLPASGAAPTGFRLEAGSASGAANLAVLSLTSRILQATAPSGTYFIRVYATNACGSSSTAPELTINVP